MHKITAGVGYDYLTRQVAAMDSSETVSYTHLDVYKRQATGAIPQIIPTPGWSTESGPAWSSSAVLIPWYLYREYGEIATLERYAPMARRYADDLLSHLRDDPWTCLLYPSRCA